VAAIAAVAPLVPELFEPTAVERRLAAAGVAVDPAQLQSEFAAVLAHVLGEATLDWPPAPGVAGVAGQAGRDGVHTEALGHLLAELQSVARANQGATW
jgi:ring-1,2-phenylacetyl-CoA epoxidase subunit PaaC